MSDAVAGIITAGGALVGVALGNYLQTRILAKQRRDEVSDRTRNERLEVAAALPGAMVAYRHTQISRRNHYLKAKALSGDGVDAVLREDAAYGVLSRDLRLARAEAWSALYRFDLLVDDWLLQRRAYALMGQLRSLKEFEDPSAVDQAGEAVHHHIQEFVALAYARMIRGDLTAGVTEEDLAARARHGLPVAVDGDAEDGD